MIETGQGTVMQEDTSNICTAVPEYTLQSMINILIFLVAFFIGALMKKLMK